MKILCWEVKSIPEPLRLPIVAGGAFITAILFAALQEQVFNDPGFKFGGLAAVVTQLMFCLCAFIEMTANGPWQRKGDLKDYVILSCCTAGGIYFTNISLHYINYPMRVMFKSSKLLPVMVLGFFIAQRKHTREEYIAASILVLGIVLFGIGDAKESPKFDMIGIFLISIGVGLDALTSNFEEKRFFRDKNCSHQEVILYSFALGSVWTLITVGASGGLGASLGHMFEKPQVWGCVCLFSFFGYLSVVFVLLLIKLFSATVAEAVKSLRKVASIAISFLFFGKVFTLWHVCGFLLFIGSVALSAYGKLQPKEKPIEYQKVSTSAEMQEDGGSAPSSNSV